MNRSFTGIVAGALALVSQTTVAANPQATSATYEQRVAAVINTPGCVAFWDFLKREQNGARRFTAHVPQGATNDFALDPGNYIKDFWGEGREARYADFPLLNRGPFGQAIRIRKEEDPTFRPFLFVPRERLHDSSIDIKGAGKSVSLVVWAIRESGNHALAGIWHEGTDLNHAGAAKVVARGQRQYALFAGLNKEGSACGHVSENGAKSFGHIYAMHKSNSGDVSPAVPADSPAEVLDAAWQCFAMTFDHERHELTGWLNGRDTGRWQENVRKAIPVIHNAWVQGHLHREPGLQPGEDTTFPTDQFYNPPEDQPVSVKVLSETADERLELQEFRYTRVKVTRRRAADGTWTTAARDLADVRLNPWWYPHDSLYSPANDGTGGPFTIGRVIHSSRSVGFTGWIGGVAVFNRALSAKELATLFDISRQTPMVKAKAKTTSPPAPGFQRLGKIKPRAAKDIVSSSWSIGGETLDRDFGVYANYQKFLGPLGAKGIRLQAGWAKCERKPGVYDFAWLDAVINDAIAQGVRPWLEVSYGNPLYPDGGGTGLGGALPKSPQALAAWDHWVRALVRRYQDRVKEWEVWNEPDLGPSPAEEYADFFIRTAEVIRAEQPTARIYALALAHKVPYAESFLARVDQRGKLALMDAITVHSYPNNPDDTRNVDQLRAIIARHGRPIAVRQGETGATSKYQENFALKKLPMTETIQAKWNLRRMLAHHGKDVPFNLFTMIDLHYRWGGKLDMNYKGLLASREDQTVAYAKPAYFAAQNVFTIFDDSLARLTNFTFIASVTNAVAAFAYAGKTGDQLITLWFKGAMPSDSNSKALVDFTFHASRFTTPVYADLRTGEVYSIPEENWSRLGDGVVLRRVPVYDSPILIAEKGVISVEAAY